MSKEPPSIWNKSKLSTAVSAAVISMLLGGCVVKPDPINTLKSLQSVKADMAVLDSEKQQINRVIDLHEAIARALKHNRQRRVSLMESALATNQLELSHFDMLPKLTAKAGYSERDRLKLSSSGTYSTSTGEFTPVDPPSYSASEYKVNHTADLEMTWNVLDFGLSYVRAGQQADRYLISRERERKAIHNLISDVRKTYWRAASAQRLLKQIGPLMERVDLALTDSRTIEEQRLQAPIDALIYQRELLDIRRSLESLQNDLKDSTAQLATLMGMTPNEKFELEGIERSGYKVLDVALDVETLEKTALAKRPELMESRYQKRITHAESRAALFSLLPGIDLNYGLHRDENDFLYFNRWADWGTKINFNLFNLIKLPSIQRKVGSDKQVADAKRLALSASVIGQVHLAAIAYEQAKQEFTTSSEYLSVVQRIHQHMAQQREAERSGDLTLIREELNSVLAQLRRDVSYANLQNSYGRIFTTAGLDPLPNEMKDDEIETITAALKVQFERWKNGEVGLVATPLANQINPWHGPGDHRFAFSDETFSLGGEVAYQATMSDGSELPKWMEFDSTTRTFSGNPPATLSQLDIEIKAANQSGARASDQFTLSLEETNDPPVGDAGEVREVSEDRVLQGNVASMDADGDPLTIRVEDGVVLPPGMMLRESGEWMIDARHGAYQHLAEGVQETHDIPLQITDPHGGRARATLQIRVTGRNDQPVIESVIKESIAEDQKITGRTIQVNDPDDGDRFSFKMMNRLAPAGFSITEQGEWAFDASAEPYQKLAEGDHRTQFVMLKAFDQHRAESSAQIQMTVTGVNDKPIISEVEDVLITLDQSNQFTTTLPDHLFTELEGEKLSFDVHQSGFFGRQPLPQWLQFDAESRQLSVASEAVAEGRPHSVTLLITAFDPHGASESRRVPVTINLPVDEPIEEGEGGSVEQPGVEQISGMDSDEGWAMTEVTRPAADWWQSESVQTAVLKLDQGVIEE